MMKLDLSKCGTVETNNSLLANTALKGLGFIQTSYEQLCLYIF